MLSICRSKSTHSTLCTVFSPHSSKTDKGKQGVILIFFFFSGGGEGELLVLGLFFFLLVAIGSALVCSRLQW